MENKDIKICSQSGADKQMIYDNLDEWLNDEDRIVCWIKEVEDILLG